MDPGACRPAHLLRRPRLRAVGRARVPAAAVRSADGRRRGVRHPPVRVPGADVVAPREELRHVVPRVPADLHPARGRDPQLHQARPRLHRPRPRTRPSCGRRAAAPAGDDGRRARSRRPGRRHRRRTDLARWRGGRLGHVRWVRALRQGVDRARLRARAISPPRTARRQSSRSRSSAGAGRRACSSSRSSIRPACECVSERRLSAPMPPPAPGAAKSSSSTGARSRSSPATASRSRSCAPASTRITAARSASPATVRNCVARGRRHRLRADVPDTGTARAGGRAPSRRRRCRRSAAIARPERRAELTDGRDVERAAGRGRCRRHRWRRQRTRAAATASGAGGRVHDPRRRAGRRGRRDLSRARRSSCGARRDGPRARPRGSSSRRAPPRSIRSCPGNSSSGIVTARAAAASRRPPGSSSARPSPSVTPMPACRASTVAGSSSASRVDGHVRSS